MANDKNEEKVFLTEEDIKNAENLVSEVLERTGIKRKLLWEEMRCRLLTDLRTAVANFKSVPVVNWAAALVDKPLESWVNNAECRKDTKKSQWQLNITSEVRNMLNEEYKKRSSEELKSVPAQYPKMHIDKVAEAVCSTIMSRARNTSNKIAIGVSIGFAALAGIKQPLILPIAAGVTAVSVYMKAKINKEQINDNLAAEYKHNDKSKDVLREHTQVLENSQYYGNIANFSERMSQKLSEVSRNEIEANNEKHEVIRKNRTDNTNIMGFWGTVAVAVPMAISYFDGGFSAMATSGVLGAASCSTCSTLGTVSIDSFLNSKIQANKAIMMAAKHMQKLKTQDNTYSMGVKTIQKEDDTIVISKDMAYQHRNFNEDGAPLLGENLFEAGSDIVIGRGVNILGGASGAGKSTLTSLLRKGALATDGSIKLGHVSESGEFVGTEYRDIVNIADNIGVAFQSAPVAECITVDEYIKLENPNADPKKVQEVKDLLGIGDADKSGVIDENASVSNRLSGGQQKRIELARVLIKDSPIMILDEPTSGVDEAMSNNIVEYLKELGKEKTIVYITHDAREVEAVGAIQAIDIDKKHSKDGINTIKTFDLTDEKVLSDYVAFFENRRSKDVQEQALVPEYTVAWDKVGKVNDERKLAYTTEYLNRVRGMLKNKTENSDVKSKNKVQGKGVAHSVSGSEMDI